MFPLNGREIWWLPKWFPASDVWVLDVDFGDLCYEALLRLKKGPPKSWVPNESPDAACRKPCTLATIWHAPAHCQLLPLDLLPIGQRPKQKFHGQSSHLLSCKMRHRSWKILEFCLLLIQKATDITRPFWGLDPARSDKSLPMLFSPWCGELKLVLHDSRNPRGMVIQKAREKKTWMIWAIVIHNS